jgi:hypothetical protein
VVVVRHPLRGGDVDVDLPVVEANVERDELLVVVVVGEEVGFRQRLGQGDARRDLVAEVEQARKVEFGSRSVSSATVRG